VQQAVDTLKHFDHPFLNGFTFWQLDFYSSKSVGYCWWVLLVF
jgi:hypothetical protein